MSKSSKENGSVILQTIPCLVKVILCAAMGTAHVEGPQLLGGLSKHLWAMQLCMHGRGAL